MLVLALDGEPRIDPVLFAFCIIPDIRVANGRQFTGSRCRGVSRRVGAVDDYFSRLVGQ